MILFFVGMPGCGKSTTGRGFADITGIPFLDLDQMIEKSEQEKISKIFETRGEEYFRDIETKKLESLKFLEDDLIVSTGGGTPCYNGNLELMQQMGLLVFLDPPLAALEERVSNTEDRPLLENGDVRKKLEDLYADRLPYYRQSDYRFSSLKIDLENLKHRLRNQLEYKS